jgi:hypothetical protein
MGVELLVDNQWHCPPALSDWLVVAKLDRRSIKSPHCLEHLNVLRMEGVAEGGVTGLGRE